MRAFVITVALASLIIPAVMADPEPAPAPSGIQQSAFVPPTPLEAFRPPSNDKNSIALDAIDKMDVHDSDAR
jgi:hypothetical protein